MSGSEVTSTAGSRLTQNRHHTGFVSLGFASGKKPCILKGSALHPLLRAFVVARQLRPDAEIRPTLEQQLNHGKANMEMVCRRVKDRRLSADSVRIHIGARIDIRSTIEQHRRRFKIPILRSDVEKRSSAQGQPSRA